MHWHDPDCPPPSTARGGNKRARSARPANVKAVKFLRKRYLENGDMEPLAVVCDVLDNPRTRTGARLHAAELAWEMTHGKIAPAQAVAAVQVNQQVVQATSVEGQPSGQLSTGERARHLAGLLKATSVLGDVCEVATAGQAPGGSGELAAGGGGSADGGAGGGGGVGA